MGYLDFAVYMLECIGFGCVAVVVMVCAWYAVDSISNAHYISERGKRRIDRLERRIADIERDIYFNGNE